MRLVSREVAELEAFPAPEIPQFHGGASTLVSDDSQSAAIATEAGLLLLYELRPTWSSTASTTAASCGETNQQKHQDEAVQSSNRELLSRGRELRGGVRSAVSDEALVGPEGLRAAWAERSLGV